MSNSDILTTKETKHSFFGTLGKLYGLVHDIVDGTSGYVSAYGRVGNTLNNYAEEMEVESKIDTTNAIKKLKELESSK